MAEKKKTETDKDTTVRKKCGIVMPIAGFDGYSSDHWKDVKEIIVDAAEKADFDANIVSYANESTVIHKTIIQNLYDNDIVVVDVSGKNPNVMFELGIRLAFDKPTIVIKDDITNYSFDTSPIDHLAYPASLHYQSISRFKDLLSNKITATYTASLQTGYSSFLKNFGEFKISQLEKKEVSETDYVLDQLKKLIVEAQRNQVNPISEELDNFNFKLSKQAIKELWYEYLASINKPHFIDPTEDLIIGLVKYINNQYSFDHSGYMLSLGMKKILEILR